MRQPVLPVTLALVLFQTVLCQHQPQTPPIKQHRFSFGNNAARFAAASQNNLAQLGPVNQNRLVNALTQQSQTGPINQNRFLNQQSQLPINQNAFVNTQNTQQSQLPVNQNGFFNGQTQQSQLPINQNPNFNAQLQSSQLPINQNGLFNQQSQLPLNPQLQNQQPINPQLQNQQPLNPQLQNQQPLNPQFQNQQPLNSLLPNQQPLNPQLQNQAFNPQLQNQQSLNPQLQSTLPVNQNSNLNNQQNQLPPFNQNANFNPQLQGLPLNQNPNFNPQLQGQPLGQNANFNPQLQGQPLSQNANFNPQLQGQPIGQTGNFNALPLGQLPINSQLPLDQQPINPQLPPGQFPINPQLQQRHPVGQNAFVSSLFTSTPKTPSTTGSGNNGFPNFADNDIPQSLGINSADFADYVRQAPGVDDPQSALETAFQWRYLDWVYPTVQRTGKNFTVGNPLTQDVAIDRKGRVFVTSPQWLDGVPVTLSMITELTSKGGPMLVPYPDSSWHTPDCNSLVSVFRVAIDECDRLWMADTGSAGGKRVCQPKLVAFDLKTDELLLRYGIPDDQTANNTAQFVNPVVDIGESCEDTFVYVADVLGQGVLVYSLKDNFSWRLNNTRGNAFGHDPEATNLTIAGESFDLTDGILGMSLTPKGLFKKRYLYYNALASFYQKFTDTDSLKRSFVYEPIVYQSIHKRVSQAGAQATSKTGATFFQLASFTALACWNVERPFTAENIVVLAQDDEKLQYVSSMKVVENAYGEEELWFNTNRLQKTINKTRRLDEINFRFIRGKVEDLIKGTRCEPTGYGADKPSLEGWQRI